MYNILVFGVCFEVVAGLLWSFNFFGGLVQYPFGSASDWLNLQNTFTPDIWMGLISGSGALIGIAALLTKQGTYALYGLLIFAIGIFYKIVVPFLLVIPNTIAALLPNSTNPNFTVVDGVTVYGINPLQVAIGILVGFAIFIFLFELVIQRKVS
jgi:hypothetical protein